MLETLTTTIAYPAKPGTPIRFAYPSGRNADSYQKHGEILVLPDGTILKETADTISVAYDARGVSVACGSGLTIPTGTVSLKLPLVVELSDQLTNGSITIGSVTDTVGGWLGKMRVVISQTAYNALATKDPNVTYFVLTDTDYTAWVAAGGKN